jgi:hypothetical protein
MCAERTDDKATWKQKNSRGSVQADRVRVMLVVNLIPLPWRVLAPGWARCPQAARTSWQAEYADT